MQIATNFARILWSHARSVDVGLQSRKDDTCFPDAGPDAGCKPATLILSNDFNVMWRRR